jgi:hypothetical protein
MSTVAEDKVFSSIRGLSEKEVEELYHDYAKKFGDCEAPKDASCSHGEHVLVGHGNVTNSYCGSFRGLKICPRAELHSQSNFDGVSHAGEVFVRKVHRSCHSPECPICCFSGWARREADHIAQRIKAASLGYVDPHGRKHMGLGVPQHIVVSPPQSDWGLAEFHNDKFRGKTRKLLSELWVLDGCLIFHGFSYANYQESLEKGVLFGWRWHPHYHCIGFIVGGYGRCRSCDKAVRTYRTRGGKTVTFHGNKFVCEGCDGFEARVRRSNEKNGYIFKVMDERHSIFATAFYQLNHSSIKGVFVK